MATRFIAGNSPIISVTKWHDLTTGEVFYDLYINGHIDNRYTLSELIKKFQEILINDI